MGVIEINDELRCRFGGIFFYALKNQNKSKTKTIDKQREIWYNKNAQIRGDIFGYILP